MRYRRPGSAITALTPDCNNHSSSAQEASPCQFHVPFMAVLLTLSLEVFLFLPRPIFCHFASSSVVTLKPAQAGHGKTGPREGRDSCCFYPAESCDGKSVFCALNRQDF